MNIPQIIIQTSLHPQFDYVVNMIKRRLPGWHYQYFSDDNIIDFFRNNTIEEFKDIEQKFYAIKNGAHRADLFRYYFLYLKGGMYLDSDAMIELPIDEIIGDARFVSVHSYHTYDNFIFNGYICASPRHPVMYEALKRLYELEPEVLTRDYFAVCRELFQIVKKYKGNDVRIYRETKPKFYEIAATTYNDGKALLRHYRFCKVIPDDAGDLAAILRNIRIYSCYIYRVLLNAIVRIFGRVKAKFIK